MAGAEALSCTLKIVSKQIETSHEQYQAFVQFIDKKTLQQAKAALKLGSSTQEMGNSPRSC